MRGIAQAVVIVLLAAAPLVADQKEELFSAVRAGDLEKVEQLIESGVPIDSANKYNSTALAMAAAGGQVEIARFLLEKGAEVDTIDSFYNVRPLDMALWKDHPEIAGLLVRYGADNRGQVLGLAIQKKDPELARVAIESGPIRESTLKQFQSSTMLSPELKAIVDGATSRPDEEPPTLTADELARFAGSFEGWASADIVEVRLEGEQLLVVVGDAEAQELEITGEQAFRSADGAIQAVFFGRAGGIEGVQLIREGSPPESMRRSVADPLGQAALAGIELPPSSDLEPTIHWPSFRGSNGRGIGDGLDVPAKWDIESGEMILWKSEIPGLGNSSPIVWGDLVILTTAVAEGVPQEIRTGLTGDGSGVTEEVVHSWRVIALNKWSGEEVWSTEVGSAVPLTRRHFKATQANSTAVTDGRHIAVAFPTVGMATLDMKGNILWQHDLGRLVVGSFYDPSDEWGFASSPILYDGNVILQVDVYGGGYLGAWDADSGELVWKTERSVAPSWATPAVIAGPDGDELIVNGSTIRAYDPETGAELWSLAPNSELVIATPVVGDGVVYVSAGYPPVKPIYAVRAGTRGEMEVDPQGADERLVWSHGRGGAYMPTPILYRGLLYVLHHNGRLVAYEASSGQAVYKSRFSKGGVFTGSPIAVNGQLYLPTEEGMMYVIAAGPEYREIAINEMGEPLMASPAVSEGILFIRTPTALVAVADRQKAAQTSP